MKVKNIFGYIGFSMMILWAGIGLNACSSDVEESNRSHASGTEMTEEENGELVPVSSTDFVQHQEEITARMESLEKRIEELEDDGSFSGWIFFTWILLAAGFAGLYMMLKKKE